MKKVLIFGGNGLVGSRFTHLQNNNFQIKAPPAEEVDILNPEALKKVVEEFNPDSIVNFAAYTNVEEAENQKGNQGGICYQVNVVGAKNVSEVSKNFDKHLVHISTEYVFDGEKEITPYTEEDTPNPINWYGQTKYLAEKGILDTGSKSVIVRISMPYSPFYELKKDVARFFLEQLKAGKQIKAVEDQQITPTLVDDIAEVLKILIEVETEGLFHVSAKDAVTPLEFVKTIAEVFCLNYSLINSLTLEEYNKTKKAKLLKNSWLNPTKFEKEFGDDILHTVDEGLVLFKQNIDGVD